MFEIKLIIYIKMDLALNSLQRLVCHKTQTTKSIISSAARPAWIAWSSVTSCSLNRHSLRWRSFVPIMRASLKSESVRFPNSQSATHWQSSVTKLLNFCPLDCLLVRNLPQGHQIFSRLAIYSMMLSMLYLSSTEVSWKVQ